MVMVSGKENALRAFELKKVSYEYLKRVIIQKILLICVHASLTSFEKSYRVAVFTSDPR